MNDPAKSFRRLVLGLVLGLVVGAMAGLDTVVLLFIVCNEAGGGYDAPNEAKPVLIFLVAEFAVAILFPFAGAFLGVRWGIRRNRREASPTGEPPASAGGVRNVP